MYDNEQSWLSRFFIPSYDELSLFLMSMTFILLLLTDSTMRADFSNIIFNKVDFRLVFPLLVIPTGLGLSIFHIFTFREKNWVEKWAMLLFAIFINATSGIFAGLHLWKTTKGWLLLFPVLNIINGVVLVILVFLMRIDEEHISNKDNTPTQAFISFILVAIISIFCQYHYELYWAITYSICVAYATNLNSAIAMPLRLKHLPAQKFQEEFEDAFDQAKSEQHRQAVGKGRYKKIENLPTNPLPTEDNNQKFRNACQQAIADGKLALEEKTELTQLAKSLSIDKQTAEEIFSEQKAIFLRSNLD